MLHYILDGYNIIHQIPQLTKGKLEDQRKNLISYIENKSPQGSSKNMVTVVFDGRADIYSDQKPSSVNVIFSRDGSADDEIRKMVDNSKIKKNTVVVTNDRDIQYAVRASGASAMSVQHFFRLEKAQEDAQSNKGRSKPASKNISNTLEFSINQEMKKIWLKKD